MMRINLGDNRSKFKLHTKSKYITMWAIAIIAVGFASVIGIAKNMPVSNSSAAAEQYTAQFYDTITGETFATDTCIPGDNEECDIIQSVAEFSSERFHEGYEFIGLSTTPDGLIEYELNSNSLRLVEDTVFYLRYNTLEPADESNLDAGTGLRMVPNQTPECNSSAKNINDAICLQDMNYLVAFTMRIGVEYELADARDGISYRVAKLEDGNVWFLDNLQLGGDNEMALNSANTNTNPNIDRGNFTLPASGDWSDSYTEPAIDTSNVSAYVGSEDPKVVGGYYNYCAASAGTYCEEPGDNEGDAEYDICPAGWRMPTGGNSGEYQTISDLYGTDLINIMHLPLSGRFYSGSASRLDQSGYFWSSTYRDGNRMYYLNRESSSLNSTGSYRRDRGYSMRCVAKDTKIEPEVNCNPEAENINDAVCLQDMNYNVKESMEEEIEYALFDSRNKKPYRVAKLKDGNIWLLDNLQLGGDNEMLLTTEDTNTNPEINNGNFTLPASGNWSDSYTEPFIDTSNMSTIVGSEDRKVVGGYYNYCATSAGTYCEEPGENTGNAEFDICPAGWRMPTGGEGGEYQTISSLYDTDLISVMHLPLAGRFYSGSAGRIEEDGYYWSSTYRDDERMYYLNRDSSSLSPTGSYRRDRGYSVRCIAKEMLPPEEHDSEDDDITVPDTGANTRGGTGQTSAILIAVLLAGAATSLGTIYRYKNKQKEQPLY